MTRPGVSVNPRKYFDVVAVDEMQAALGIQLHELPHILGVDAAMMTARLPRVSRVISELLLLNPDRCFWEKVNAAHVVPMGVADDDVGDLLRLDAGQLHCFVGANVVCRWKRFEESIVVKAAVKEDVAAAAPD